MDCTYKTNRFGLPLLNIIGCTGMNSTIHLAQCYLRRECEGNFDWALGRLRRLFVAEDIPIPQVILTDREEALLNALETHWHDVPSLLCLWHIFKDIQKHVREHRFHKVLDESRSTATKREYIDSKEHTAFCTAFVRLTESSTEDEYKQLLELLRTLDEGETQYIEATWLDIWKTRIVHCWTKAVTHFGMQTTSRVEGYHATMKRWLCNSTADLLTVHDRMTIWWKDSVEKHEQAMADSEHGILNSFRKPLYGEVVKIIHNHALKICHGLLQTNPSLRPCSGEYRHTHGLPCIHELHEHQARNEPLSPSLFHPHWWITPRNRYPGTLPPRVLEPRTIADLRAIRARTRLEARGQGQSQGSTRGRRGGGARGNRRVSSAFEISETAPPPSVVANTFVSLPEIDDSTGIPSVWL